MTALPKRRVEVVMPPKKFREIEDEPEEEEEEEEEEDGEGEGEEEEEEDEEDKEIGSGSGSGMILGDLYNPPCGKCGKTGRDCERGETGGACLSCN